MRKKKTPIEKILEGREFLVYTALIIIVSTIAGLAFFNFQPLYGDQAVYAQMIDELIRDPGSIPTYLGNPAPWKLPLGFYALAGMTWLFSLSFPKMPVEVLYRLPGLVFLAWNSLTVFFIASRLYPKRKELAMAAGLIFALTNETLMSVSGVLLLEGPLLFFMLLSLLMFLQAEKNKKFFYWAGLFFACAVMVKTFVAFLAPLYAAIYYYAKGKDKLLKSKEFIGCLLLFPAVLFGYGVLYWLLVSPFGDAAFSSYVYDLVGRVGGKSLAQTIMDNATQLFRNAFPWILLPVAGAISLAPWRNKTDKAVSLWLLVTILPLLNSTGYYWYFMPVIPVLSILSALALRKLDPITMVMVFMALLFVSAAAYPMVQSPASPELWEQKETGLFLTNKNSRILSISEEGLPEVFFYKLHHEKNPDYSGIKQIVPDPYEKEGYTTIADFTGVVYDKYERNCINYPDYPPECVSQIVQENKQSTEYLVMDREIYEEYSQSPVEGYEKVFESSYGGYYVLQRLEEP